MASTLIKNTSLVIILTAFAFTVVSAGSALAETTWYVDDDAPADFSTIQAALDAASAGDTIIVRDGTYTGTGNRDIDFGGKAVHLRSENGPQNCIIDCQGSFAEWGRGFYFHSGEDEGSVVDGFTITNGFECGGGGIYCDGSSPTITNNTITGNVGALPRFGGGIYCYESSPTISNNTITGNTGNGGAGILCSNSSPTITNNTITANTARYGGGIYCGSSSSPTITNNTITANTAYFGNGGGIFCSASSPKITNNTITANTAANGGGIYCDGSSPTITNSILWGNSAPAGPEIYLLNSSALTVRYSDVAGGAGAAFVEPGSVLNLDSTNIEADPLFVDPGKGDFELGENSRAIDSATAIGAPALDMLGRPRRNDAGMPNVGSGYPAYVDMGALERQENTPARDLVVTRVSDPDPEFLSVGESFTIEWTVLSDGMEACIGPWQDTVYLSDDPYVSPDDAMMGTRTFQGGTLSIGSSYTETLVQAVPLGLSGPKYVLVHTNADRAILNEYETNNIAISPTAIDIDVPLIQIGFPESGTVAEGQWQYYRFEGELGRTVVFSLDVADGDCRLYVRRDFAPTVSSYDTTGLPYGLPHQEARLFNPEAATYYIGFYAEHTPAGTTDYVLFATLPDFAVHDVSPGLVGNAGRATLKITGDGFTPEAVVELVSSDGSIRISSDLFYQDATTLFATFHLADAAAPPSNYYVVVTIPGPETAMWGDMLTVAEGGEPAFKANISMPAVSRPGRVIDVHVEYQNTGIIDVTSPLLTLDSGVDDCQWQLPGSEEWTTGPELRLLALSTSGPANILRPGQSETVTVKVRIPQQSQQLQLSLSSLGAEPDDGSAEAIDWSQWYSDATMIADMEERFGTSWGEYVAALGKMAAEVAVLEGPQFSAKDMEFRVLLGGVFDESAALGHMSKAMDSSGEHGPSVNWLNPYDSVHVYEWNRSTDAWEGAPVQPGDGLVADAKTAVIIHGNLNTIQEDWVKGMAIALETRPEVRNILGVDWGSLSMLGLNPQITSLFIPSVADRAYAELAALPIAPEQMHLIGHSHGAHVAGLIGERFGPKRIARITALDASEEGVHLSVRNLGGNGWGYSQGSAAFIDFYKSSVIFGGETFWGRDNFLLVEERRTWGQGGRWGELTHDHGYSCQWYTGTIQKQRDALGLGYYWNSGSWTDALGSFPNLRTTAGPWKGLIRGAFGAQDNVSVIECFPQHQNEWNYPGAWLGGYDDSPAINGMLDNLAAAVEMELSDVSVTGGGGMENELEAGGAAEITYKITNNADNLSIVRSHRFNAQMGNNMGFLSRPGPGPICDVAWLSKDQAEGRDLNPETDWRLTHAWHEKFLGTEAEGEHVQDFEMDVMIPDRDTILKFWKDDELQAQYYIILDLGSTRSGKLQPYPGELYPDNNILPIEVTISGDGLFADAGPDQFIRLANGETTINLKLDGSRSGPGEKINHYEWTYSGSVLGTSETIYHAFSEGTHQVDLTVHDYGDDGSPGGGDDRTAEDYVVILVAAPPPDPPGEPEGGGTTTVVAPRDPEDKFGPAGYDPPGTAEGDEQRFITGDDHMMFYRIEFWNEPNAPVAAQDAILQDILDPTVFDLNTFEFTRVGFLAWDVPLPGGQAIDIRVDARPEMNLAVDVTASLDAQTGVVEWWFHCVDPLTGDYPEDIMAGFLPPFNPDTGFELGWIEFQVRLKPDLSTGTVVSNRAWGEFDFASDINDHLNPAPPDGPWINTIDAGAPSSNVQPLAEISATADGAEVLVEWVGQDDAGGSGIRSYDLYAATDGGPFVRWLQHTAEAQATFTLQPGRTYAFYSVALDNVGNIEQPPAQEQPDATIAIRLRGDVNGDCKVGILDFIHIRNHLRDDPAVGDNWKYDLNNDGSINVLDMIVVRINVRARCP